MSWSSSLTPDLTPSAMRSGLLFALCSAACFGLTGAVAKPLLDTGWSSAGVVIARVGCAAALLAIPAWWSLRGRTHLLRQEWRLVLAYGVFAIAGTQLAFFNAVSRMSVGVAILIEFTAPIAVVGWMWLRHGQRPAPLVFLGSAIAGAGLLMVLDLTGRGVDPVGAFWALVAMGCLAMFFVLSAQPTHLPPLGLAGPGLLTGMLVLVAAGSLGVLEVSRSGADVRYTFGALPWWGAVLALGLMAGALAYTFGIGASRRLGARLASFVALLEVVFAITFAWLLLGETAGLLQAIGGLLVLTGVVVIKRAESAGLPDREPERMPVTV